MVADTSEYIEGTGYQVNRAVAEKLHRGEYSIQGHIDLHGLSVKDAGDAFEDFLKENCGSLLSSIGTGIVHSSRIPSPLAGS